MPRVSRVRGGLCAVALVLALGHALAGTTTAGAIPVPEGPRLAFTALSALSPSGITVGTVGSVSPRPLLLARGSRDGVTPNPLGGVSWSADGSMLAFAGSKGSRRGIYVIRSDGTGLHFVRGTGQGANPVFSPDGRSIAFSRKPRAGKLFLGTTPWVARVGGGHARRLADWHKGVEYTPSSFSPDGSSLAVTRTKFASIRPKALLLALDGSGDMRPLAKFPAAEPVYSPDGARIVLVRHSFSDGPIAEAIHRDLYVMRADGTGLSRLTRTPWIAETHPSWDPSGERIAFNSFHISRDPFEAIFDEVLPVGNSIAQINADGSCREKVLSLPNAAVFGAKWRPGPGREAGRIDCGLRDEVDLGPPGPRLAVVKFDLSLFRFDLETVDETGAQPSRLAGGGELKRPLPEWFDAPTWSPDGSLIVFAGVSRGLSGGPRGTRLYVSRADGSGLRPLRGTRGATEPVFSPDGATVAFTRVRFRPTRNDRGEREFVARGTSVWLVGLTGDAPTRVTPARRGLALYAESFSPDGTTLLATRSHDWRRWDVVTIDMVSRKIDLLVRHADDPVYSPTGDRIAFVRRHRSRRPHRGPVETADVFTVSSGGGGLTQLTHGGGDALFPSWDPSGERLAFVRYRQATTELAEIGMGSAVMQVNADGSCLRAVLRPSPKTAFYGASWQPGPGREAGPIAC